MDVSVRRLTWGAHTQEKQGRAQHTAAKPSAQRRGERRRGELGRAPMAISIAVMPRLQRSAFSLYPALGPPLSFFCDTSITSGAIQNGVPAARRRRGPSDHGRAQVRSEASSVVSVSGQVCSAEVSHP